MEANLAALGVQPVEAPTPIEPLPGQRRIPFNDNLLFPGSHMTTKTAPKPKATTKPQQTDDELLQWALGCYGKTSPADTVLRGYQSSGAADAELFTALKTEFSGPNSGSARDYAVMATEDELRIWFDTDVPRGVPNLWASQSGDKFEGDLLKATRRVLGIDEPKTDGVLRSTLLHGITRFQPLQVDGATDDQVLVAIRETWRALKHAPKRTFAVTISDARWGAAIWFNTNSPAKPDDDEPSLHGRSLIASVRRVLEIPNINAAEVPVKSERVAKPANGKKPKLDQVPAGVTFGPVESRSVDWFTDSPYQEREEASKEWLEELGNSLLICQLEALVCRPTGELISGHTRVLAAKRKGIETLEYRAVDCDDTTAERLVFLYNTKHRDLTNREKCRHYVGLMERYTRAGLTHGQLAQDLSLDKSTLSNELRLASIPDELWNRYDADGLKVHQLRRLSTHAAREPFVAGFVGYLKTIGCAEDVQPTPDHFEKAFAKGIERAFRPMTKDEFGAGCQFKPTAAQKKELDLVEVDRFGGKVLMAGNVKLWTELNEAAIAVAQIKTSETAAEQDSDDETADASPAAVSDKVQKDAQKQQRSDAVLHAWSLAYADSISHRFMGKMKRQDMPTILRLVALIQRETHGFNMSFRIALDNLLGADEDILEVGSVLIETFFDPQEQHNGWTNLEWGELLKVADWLELSPVKYWRPTRTLLDTCTDKELTGFLKELQLLPSDREANIEQLLNEWKVGQVPNAFVLKRGK